MRLNRLLVPVLVLTLSACGFQLREQVDLPARLASLRIEGVDPYSPLQRNLELALRRSGARLAETAEGNGVLRVFTQRIDRLPLSVGDTGRVQEYLMRYTVDFELVDDAGSVVLPRQLVELDRDYTFDTQQALGTPGEEEIVRAELERDMVATILRRIDAAVRGGG
jgi:LPS-assembly lipoprotein